MAQVRESGFSAKGLSRRAGFATPGRVAACLLSLVLVVLVAGFVVVAEPFGGGSSFEVERGDISEVAAQDDASDQVIEQKIVVHVDGCVACPGVYELVGETVRVNDAVAAAGGLAEDADTSTLNLASTVTDGQKIHVPSAEEAQVVSAADTASATGDVASSLININTASVSELQELSGVGEATATAIVEDRQNNGPFSSIEDLMRVSGIGEKKFAKLKGQICV